MCYFCNTLKLLDKKYMIEDQKDEYFSEQSRLLSPRKDDEGMVEIDDDHFIIVTGINITYLKRIEKSGKFFYVHHRIDGPAYFDSNGTKVWEINGKDITQQIYEWSIAHEIDLYNLTDEDIALIKITWI